MMRICDLPRWMGSKSSLEARRKGVMTSSSLSERMLNGCAGVKTSLDDEATDDVDGCCSRCFHSREGLKMSASSPLPA